MNNSNRLPAGLQLVVTDLDGTLLDHHNYSYEAATPALALLAELSIPVVFNTSKTRAEVEALRQHLNNRAPFIVENGSAVFLPQSLFRQPPPNCEMRGEYWCHIEGEKRENIVATLARLRQENHWRFEGYGDWGLAEVMAHTGLDEAGAALSLEREFSEPLLWHDSDAAFADFQQQLDAAGLQIRCGGRFVHVLGRCDKGAATLWLARCLAEKNHSTQVTKTNTGGTEANHRNSEASPDNHPRPGIIALGDGANDLDMLAIADQPVLVRSPVNDFPEFSHPALYRTDNTGPAGWQEAINRFSQDLRKPSHG